MEVLYEDKKNKYSLIEKEVFEFLEPTRGDILFEKILFELFQEKMEKFGINYEIEKNLYFSVENETNLYIVILTSNCLEFYISKGDIKEGKEEIIEFIGFLIGYIKGYFGILSGKG